MTSTKRWQRWTGGAGLVAAGVVAGGVLAGTLTANAAEETTTPDSSTSQPADGPRPQRGDEEALTGDTETAVEEAVLAEYPGATIERTETDSTGVYEAHVVTAEGEHLTVLVDESFTVTGTETGRAGGGPRGGGDCDEEGSTTEDGTATEEGGGTTEG